MARKPRAPETFNYKSIPALAAYIDRVGATMMSYRKYMVREQLGNGYYKEVAIIRIDEEHIINCTHKDYAPTKKEVEEIAAAIRDVKWPEHIGATEALLRSLMSVAQTNLDMLFVFWNRQTGLIDFVQERRNHKDGTKDYFPWTYYNDGRWRQMEPPDKLPLWKPKVKRSNKIMIHEGAKTARFVEELCTSKEKEYAAIRTVHPWYEELKEYEHWGQVGGALAAHRADYREVAKEKPTEVVYVCDNDPPGMRADSDVSRAYGGLLYIVKFDNRWKYGFDLADPMEPGKDCARLFNKKGKYIGPSIKQLIQPATWATDLVPNPSGKGAAQIRLRPIFLESIEHSVKPLLFVFKHRYDLIYSADEFDNVVAPFSNSVNTSSIVLRDNASKAIQLDYNPSREPGIYATSDNRRRINTHIPTSLVAREGDASTFIEYMEYLIPEEKDRIETLRYMATLAHHPEIRIQYSMLLISETQGIGKTTLGERIMRPIVGMNNSSVVSGESLVNPNFNGWAAHKRLIICNEIYHGHNLKAYDNLKSVITEGTISINEKFQKAYEIDNWVHVIACSNSLKALKLDENDRRWFIPSLNNTKKPPAYWERFFNWLEDEDGISIVYGWLKKFLSPASGKDKSIYTGHSPIYKGDMPPSSSLKQQVINENLSKGLLMVAGVIDKVKEDAEAKNEEVFLIDSQLQDLIRNKMYDGRHNDRLESYLTIRKLALNRGWFARNGEVGMAQNPQWNTRGVRSTILYSTAKFAKTSWIDLVKEGRKPADLTWFSSLM